MVRALVSVTHSGDCMLASEKLSAAASRDCDLRMADDDADPLPVLPPGP